MSNITKCKDKTCPSKANCYRFTAPENGETQSFAVFNHTPGAPYCEDYLMLTSGRRVV